MSLVTPFWFKQRQATAAESGADCYRLTAPNQEEAFIAIHAAADGRWSASLRRSADGPAVATTEPVFTTHVDAWDAAFELYRQHLIV